MAICETSSGISIQISHNIKQRSGVMDLVISLSCIALQCNMNQNIQQNEDSIGSPCQVRAIIVTKGEFQDLSERTLCNEFSSTFIQMDRSATN